jgi:FkbM family methyltransferase
VIVRNVIKGRSVAFFVTNPDDAIMKFHYRGSFYEAEELEVIARYCEGGATFLDIGANVGNHTVFLSHFAKLSKVIVFEPNQKVISILKRNLALNACVNVDTHFLGLALAAGKTHLNQTTPDSNNLGHTRYSEDASGLVPAIDGDALIFDEPTSFIKIDVEGMELEVLSGLHQTILRWQPTIFVEVLDSTLNAFVEWCERFSYLPIHRFQRYDGIKNYLIRPMSTVAAAAARGSLEYQLRELLCRVPYRPQNGSNWHDLAQRYHDDGRLFEAAVFFVRSAKLDGASMLTWPARAQYARCLRDLNDRDGFVRIALGAFCERPDQAQPLIDLANHYLDTNQAMSALFYAEAALAVSKLGCNVAHGDSRFNEFHLFHTFGAAAY